MHSGMSLTGRLMLGYLLPLGAGLILALRPIYGFPLLFLFLARTAKHLLVLGAVWGRSSWSDGYTATPSVITMGLLQRRWSVEKVLFSSQTSRRSTSCTRARPHLTSPLNPGSRQGRPPGLDRGSATGQFHALPTAVDVMCRRGLFAILAISNCACVSDGLAVPRCRTPEATLVGRYRARSICHVPCRPCGFYAVI